MASRYETMSGSSGSNSSGFNFEVANLIEDQLVIPKLKGNNPSELGSSYNWMYEWKDSYSQN